MNYVKKMCILRQIKQGFSGDGKALSGLIKIEQYGKNLAVEVAIINFAPLVSGDYYCLLSDNKGKTEMLCLRGKSLFNILSDLDISGGFCGIVCYVKNEVVPIAYGINGNGSYDWKSILNATLPPVFPRATQENAMTEISQTILSSPSQPLENGAQETANSPTQETERESSTHVDEPTENNDTSYNDDRVATVNYYEEEQDERKQLPQVGENAHTQSASQGEAPKKGANATENGNAESVLNPFKTNPDGYYLSVKAEIDELFKTYPSDKTLCNAFSSSEWVCVKGTPNRPEYLVGVLYEDGRAQYICYALVAENKDSPPEEIKNVCTFVPLSLFDDNDGFFVIFQSAASGECIRPNRA